MPDGAFLPWGSCWALPGQRIWFGLIVGPDVHHVVLVGSFGWGGRKHEDVNRYATSRAEMDIRDTHFYPQRSDDGMRYGVVGVECCAGGDFYAHLPQVG